MKISDLPLNTEFIQLIHGSGGHATSKLIHKLIAPKLGMDISLLDDAATLNLNGVNLAFTTDSFVVSPYRFPGGDIGKLSVCGTVNDLAVQGAEPIALSLSLIVEEGLPLDELERLMESISTASLEANVKIVTGDTKVVGKGSCDKIFINTSGIGLLKFPAALRKHMIVPSDAIVASGPVGTHGVAVMGSRFDFGLQDDLVSDCQPLNKITSSVFTKLEGDVKWMRDPTRGGLSNLLNELCRDINCDLEIIERQIPIQKSAKLVADMLGIDILESASEGIFICIVSNSRTQQALDLIEKASGVKAACIGHVGQPSNRPRVFLNTAVGGKTIVNQPTGEQLPRIC